MLQLVPYVVAHPGVGLAELTDVFGVPEAELRKDLSLLFLTGTPPFGPGDLVEVDIDRDRVWISMADHLARPQRLTVPEAVSLYLRGKALQGTGGFPEAPALASALAKIERVMGEDLLAELKDHVEPADAPEASEVLDRVWAATRAHERISIVYYAQSRDEMTERTIEPEQVYAALGHWYVVAWDPAAGGERMFRIDRVKEVAETGERFHPRGLEGPGRPLYSPSDEDLHVRLLLHPRGRWVAEYYEISEEVERGEDLEVVLPTRSLAWVAKLAVRLGADAEILGPVELRDAVRDLAERTLAGYR